MNEDTFIFIQTYIIEISHSLSIYCFTVHDNSSVILQAKQQQTKQTVPCPCPIIFSFYKMTVILISKDDNNIRVHAYL